MGNAADKPSDMLEISQETKDNHSDYDSDSNSDNATRELSTVVIDNGSHQIKAGFSGDEAPYTTFESIIGEPIMKQSMVGISQQKIFCGHQARSKRSILSTRSPFNHGTVINWNDMENLWGYTFHTELQRNPEESKCFITEKLYNPIVNASNTTQIMFEKFNVASFYIHTDAALALYGYGDTTGTVVDCGHGSTSCISVYNGDILTNSARRLEVGGEHITNYFMMLLNQEVGSLNLSFSNSMVKAYVLLCFHNYVSRKFLCFLCFLFIKCIYLG
eukprot:75012_1